jgi:hypothetical protein
MYTLLIPLKGYKFEYSDYTPNCGQSPQKIKLFRGDKVMKLMVRAFVLSVFAAGASAAVVSSHAANRVVIATPSHQVVSASIPTPPYGCPSQLNACAK